MEVSLEVMDGPDEDERKGDCRKKLLSLMQLENVKDYIKMLSKEIPDMVLVADNGQRVTCHRSLISLFSPSLTDIINAVPGWLDTVILLPDTSYQSLTYIVNTLYSDIAIEVPGNVDQEDLEDTAKIMGVKIPALNIEKSQGREEIEEVPTLDENIIKEATDIEMGNVEAPKDFMENYDVENISKLQIDRKETEDVTTLDESIIVESNAVEKINIQPSELESNSSGEQSIVTSFFDKTEQSVSDFILEILMEEINNIILKVPLNMKSREIPGHCLDYSPPMENGEEAEAVKKAHLESPSEEYEITTAAPVSEIREYSKGISNSNHYKISWIPDEEIEMIEDNFVEKAITHIPLPSKPKKSLSSKKKEKNAAKENKISESKIEEKEQKISTKIRDVLVKVATEDNSQTEKNLTRSRESAADLEAATEYVNPPKKPRISLVSLNKLLAVPTTVDSFISSNFNIHQQTLEAKLPAESTGEISENATDREMNIADKMISKTKTTTDQSHEEENNSNSTNNVPMDSDNMITSAAKKRRIEDFWKVDKSSGSKECQEKFYDGTKIEEAINLSNLKSLQEPVIENITVKADPSDFLLDASLHLTETDSHQGTVEDPSIASMNSTEQTKLTTNVTDIPSLSISETPKATEPATPPLIKEEPAKTSPKIDNAPTSENHVLADKDVAISEAQDCKENDSPAILKPKNIHCDLCLESFSLKIDLARHYSKIHFKTELSESLPDFFPSGDFCVQCKETIDEANEDKLEHVGEKHKKVFFVMKGKGMNVIELFRENRIRKYKPPPPESLIIVKNKTTNSPKIKSTTKIQAKTSKVLNIGEKHIKNAPRPGPLNDFPVGCEKCTLKFSSGPQLLKHYSIVHFFGLLKAKIPEFFTKAKCKKCGHSLLNEKDKVVHIGFKHDIVKDLLLIADSKAPVKTKSPLAGSSQLLPVLPTSRVPVILHGTTKIVFEADKPPTNSIQDNKNKKKHEAPQSGVKFFKLSPSVHCKMVEEKDPLALPSPPKIPEMKGIKITHKSHTDINQPPPRSPAAEKTVIKEHELSENKENIPEREPVENGEINPVHDNQNNELKGDKFELHEKQESKDTDRDETTNAKENMSTDENEDESIARALAESLNTFESETKNNETETTNSHIGAMRNTSMNPDSKEEEVERQNDDFFRVKRNARNANEPRNFKCTICPKRYTNNPHLNDHYTGFHFKDELCLKYGNPDESLTCIFCGKVCMNKVKYAMHIGNVHRKLEEFGIKFKNSNPKRPRSSLGTLVKSDSA